MKNHFIFNKELVKESIKKAGLTYAELAKIFADNNVNITEQSIKYPFNFESIYKIYLKKYKSIF